MKIRNGFVSNSSSSSFFCVLSKKDHDKIMSELTKKQQKIINKYIENEKIGDMDVVGYGYASDRNGGSLYSGDIYFNEYQEEGDEIQYEDFDDATVAYEKSIKDAKIKTFKLDFDF